MNIVHTGAWLKLKKCLNEDRAEFIERLIAADNEKDTAELRGRIKQIDDIIEAYPQRFSDEQEED